MPRVMSGVIAGAMFAAAFLATLGMDGSLHYPLAYPQVLLAAISLLFVLSAARDWMGGEVASVSSAAPDAAGGPVVLWATIMLCVAYAASWTLIGFFPATFIYIVIQLWLLRQRQWHFLLGVPAVVILVTYVVFARLLAMPFPGGAWS
jgi:Tripartite tricarboxylate transporter TctB family